MQRIYLDFNATCPPQQAALAAAEQVARLHWANPSSLHHEGRESRAVLEKARGQVAEAMDVPPASVFFTSGGTEAAHAALLGVARAADRKGRVVYSGLEHACVLSVVSRLQSEGFETVAVTPEASGVVDPEKFLAVCSRQETIAAALIVAHNEIGTLQPVQEVASALQHRGIPLVADSVQAAGRLETPWPRLENVLGLLSGHKFGGLAGAGAVVADADLRLEPTLGGGEQEQGRRGGTPPLALIAAMGAAAQKLRAGKTGWGAVAGRRNEFENRLLKAVDDVRILGREQPRLPNTSAFLVDGVLGEDLVAALDLAGISVSTGAACSTGSSRPSASLLAMGLERETARQLVRVSLDLETSNRELETTVDRIQQAVRRSRYHTSPVQVAR